MRYTLRFEPRVQKQVNALDKPVRRRVISFLTEKLDLDRPRSLGSPLTSEEHLWRYRVGDVRIVVKIDDDELIVLVVRVGHRGQVYR